MANKATVLVTGASGYIASHVVKILLDSNEYLVRGTVRSLKNAKKCDPLKKLSPNVENLELIEADLLNAESWPKAVKGCDYVIHMASPFPSVDPSNPDDLIKPAVEGTIRVMEACLAAGSVKRVILTSSIASIFSDGASTKAYTEADWTDVNSSGVNAYARSKTLAEKAAWEFIEKNPSMELAVINPGFVMGPLLHDSDCTSAELMQRLLTFGMPMIPKLSFSMVDVRDVALAHVKAMSEPAAAGNRHILVNRTMWLKEIADIVSREFKPQGYMVPSMVAPYPFVWLISWVDKGARLILGSIGKFPQYDNTRMKTVLGINPIDEKSTILEMAYSVIERGFVKKTRNYKLPSN